MEAQGALRLSPWTGLGCILLLSGTLEIRGADIYTVPGHPLILNVPNCILVSESDTIEWEDEGVRLGKWRNSAPTYSHDCNSNLCTIHSNGTLTIQKPKETTTKYSVKVYESAGILKCNDTMTVIMEAEELKLPILSYNCTSVGASISCTTTARSAANLTLSWGTNLQTTLEKSMTRSIKEQNVPVRCIVRNRNHEKEETVTIKCPVWDLYLIVSVVGGGVALLIFIALVVYSVKYKPWRRHSRIEDDVEMNRSQPNTVQRQVPHAVVQRHSPPGESTAHCLIQRPPSPEDRKGKPYKSRRLPPPAPGQATPAPGQTTAAPGQATPAPGQATPALPGNHPSEQAPRPQPRTKSKPPRNKGSKRGRPAH